MRNSKEHVDTLSVYIEHKDVQPSVEILGKFSELKLKKDEGRDYIGPIPKMN